MGLIWETALVANHRRLQRNDRRRLVEGIVQQHRQLVDEHECELIVLVQELDGHVAVSGRCFS